VSVWPKASSTASRAPLVICVRVPRRQSDLVFGFISCRCGDVFTVEQRRKHVRPSTTRAEHHSLSSVRYRGNCALAHADRCSRSLAPVTPQCLKHSRHLVLYERRKISDDIISTNCVGLCDVLPVFCIYCTRHPQLLWMNFECRLISHASEFFGRRTRKSKFTRNQKLSRIERSGEGR